MAQQNILHVSYNTIIQNKDFQLFIVPPYIANCI